ncbi:hypothetical protein AOX59_14940 [Lentibacillus amyloliquefaciens]|uniref:Lipoprotein n=2 Tax=Lentibacillus amyloliquefaciens TaxID=1472767 RepID=A0A0U3NT11_9BACI|nr:hypothetical protein AOX59_14940 [Lentibacillus amyloliquefaciens]
MRIRRLLTLILLSVLLVFSACGGTDSAAEDNSDKPKVGLNEITLDNMIAKKDNNEAFYVLIYDAKKEYVKSTKLLEAYDEAFKKEDITVFHLNIRDANEQTVSRLDEEYESHSGSSHNPFMYGEIAVVHDGKLSSPFDYYGESWNLNRLIGEVGSESDTFFNDNRNKTIKKSIQYSLDYTKDEEIELTY